MTGKELKEWAAQIPDEAIIQMDWYGWTSVDTRKIRAMFTSHPVDKEDATPKEESADVNG